MFNGYLQLGSVPALAAALKAEGFTGKRWIGRKGREMGGGFLSRGALYYLLSNPTFLGVTRHKDKRYENTHPAIDDRGNRMVAAHTSRGAKRYRYFVSNPKITEKGTAGSVARISSGMLEDFLAKRVEAWISAG